jgi:L-gulono-1,4-lactone dehydrogenase
MVSPRSGEPELHNWTRDQHWVPRALEAPADRSELVDVLVRAAEWDCPARVVGGSHSMNGGPITDGVAISLHRMKSVVDVDRAKGRVRVEAGIELNELNEFLWREGLALRNQGDIGDQSIAGAIATGTHGTGSGLHGLSASVRALNLTLADGGRIEIDEEDPGTLSAAQVNLGALGVVTEVDLEVVPAFTLAGSDSPMPLNRVLGELDHLLAENDHFQFYKFPYSEAAVTRVANRVEGPPRPPGRVRGGVEEMFHRSFGPICRVGRSFTKAIPWINRAVARAAGTPRRIERSYRILNRPQPVPFTEMEYALPREHIAEAIRAIDEITRRHRFAAPFPLQVRFAAPDEALLSPATGRSTGYIAVHMFAGMPWEPYFRAAEDILTALGGRPHWGKRHSLAAAELSRLYPGWDDFLAVRERFDPGGRFANDYVRRVLGGGGRVAVSGDA